MTDDLSEAGITLLMVERCLLPRRKDFRRHLNGLGIIDVFRDSHVVYQAITQPKLSIFRGSVKPTLLMT